MPSVQLVDLQDVIRGFYLLAFNRGPDEAGMAHWTNGLLNGLSPFEIAKSFIDSDEYRSYHRIKLFVPPGHFYSPIVDPSEAERQFATIEANGYPNALPGIELDRTEMVRTWRELLPFLNRCPFPDTPSPGFRYAFENPSYSWGDGSILYAMLLKHRPRKVVEIGCGWSSACIIDTVEQELGGQCELTFIDPYPQLLWKFIGDKASHIRVFECGVQSAPLEVFDKLEKDDILFIDSTHVLRTGSDVCFELFEGLPRCSPGVLVHLHDMFWPFEYPRSWAIDENRSWNEVYAIRAFLTCNKDWEIVMFNDFLGKFERALIDVTYPKFLRSIGGALWLRRRLISN